MLRSLLLLLGQIKMKTIALVFVLFDGVFNIFTENLTKLLTSWLGRGLIGQRICWCFSDFVYVIVLFALLIMLKAAGGFAGVLLCFPCPSNPLKKIPRL